MPRLMMGLPIGLRVIFFFLKIDIGLRYETPLLRNLTKIMDADG